jgi:hypothetical protein
MTLKKEMEPLVTLITRGPQNATKVRSLEVVDKYTKQFNVLRYDL